jgi:hypothetical protein
LDQVQNLLLHLIIHENPNENMYKKITSFVVFSIALNLSLQSIAFAVPTKWERVEASLSDLLNSGWQLSGISSNRAAYRNSVSPGGFDEETYIFSLAKNGKYIICLMPNPVDPVANAGCRRIN